MHTLYNFILSSFSQSQNTCTYVVLTAHAQQDSQLKEQAKPHAVANSLTFCATNRSIQLLCGITMSPASSSLISRKGRVPSAVSGFSSCHWSRVRRTSSKGWPANLKRRRVSSARPVASKYVNLYEVIFAHLFRSKSPRSLYLPGFASPCFGSKLTLLLRYSSGAGLGRTVFLSVRKRSSRLCICQANHVLSKTPAREQVRTCSRLDVGR